MMFRRRKRSRHGHGLGVNERWIFRVFPHSSCMHDMALRFLRCLVRKINRATSWFPNVQSRDFQNCVHDADSSHAWLHVIPRHLLNVMVLVSSSLILVFLMQFLLKQLDPFGSRTQNAFWRYSLQTMLCSQWCNMQQSHYGAFRVQLQNTRAFFQS